jgi:acetyl-CoA synthetase
VFAAQLGKALAPRTVIFLNDIPKTRNAKVMRRVVRAAYLGEKLGDISALENPASLDERAYADENLWDHI